MGRRKDNGKWTNPGGHANDGEAPIDAGIREAKEETGLDLTQDRLYHLDTRIIHKPSGEKLKIVAYKVNLDEGPTTIKNDPDDEVHRWVWISLAKPLNKKVFGNLHVPQDNVILDSLGVQMEKKAFFSGFEKRSSPKWIKMLRSGKLDPKKIPQAAGGQIRQLDRKPIGQGMEGVVHKVTHPKGRGGIAVQKSTDPASPFHTKNTYRDKLKVLENVKHPGLAEYYGKKKGKNITYHEYIKSPKNAPRPNNRGSEFEGLSKSERLRHKNLVKGVSRAAEARGVRIGDTHPGNILHKTRKDPKVVDFLAKPRGFDKIRSFFKKRNSGKSGYPIWKGLTLGVPPQQTVMKRVHSGKNMSADEIRRIREGQIRRGSKKRKTTL